jgi:hypothetical protein
MAHVFVSRISFAAFLLAVAVYGTAKASAACNQPPIPSTGQTVTWTTAGSPYQICADLTVPKGGTVIVQPAVQVDFQGHMVTVAGAVNALGSSTSHIVITAQGVFPPTFQLSGGSLTMTFADITGQIRSGPGKLTISDSTFAGPNGLIFTLDVLLPSNPPIVKLTRCTFVNSSMGIADSYLALTNSTFTNSSGSVLRGYTRLQGTNTFNGAPFAILRETIQAVQPMLVDGVVASNVSTGGGLSLTGGNFLLGSKNVLQSNLYPVDVEGGLLPASKIPTTGNTNNLIWAHDGGGGPTARWASLGLPYLVDGSINGGGTLTIDPGVTVLFDPTKTGSAGLNFVSSRRLIANGLPTAPIVLDARNAGIQWDGLIFQTNRTEGNRLDYVTSQNARFGASVSDSFLDVTNSLLQNNSTGINTNTFASANLSKTRLLNNGIGAEATQLGSYLLSATGLSPNWFEGNTTAGVSNSGSTIPAQNNYWGSSTGPTNPNNPGGQGDKITGSLTFTPFLTSPPNIVNNPPVVRLVPPGNSWFGIDTITRPPEFFANPGEKMILRWNVTNSATVASQRILLSVQGADFDSTPPIVLADNIPAGVRSFEITLPSVGFQVTNLPQFLRVVAIDSSGQQGWDQTPIVIASGRVTGTLQITTDYAGKTFVGGHATPKETWTGSTNGGTTEGYIFLESDGGLFTTIGSFIPLPIVSTDTARQVVVAHNNSNDAQWFFSSTYFSIRPDAALGLQAPIVHLTSPTAGQSFNGGSTVPITWTASAQQGLGSFDIQYSTNGGLTWHFITQGLSATSRSFNWVLPASTGIPDARVRVIGRDKIFQNSSDGAGIVFSITP